MCLLISNSKLNRVLSRYSCWMQLCWNLISLSVNHVARWSDLQLCYGKCCMRIDKVLFLQFKKKHRICAMELWLLCCACIGVSPLLTSPHLTSTASQLIYFSLTYCPPLAIFVSYLMILSFTKWITFTNLCELSVRIVFYRSSSLRRHCDSFFHISSSFSQREKYLWFLRLVTCESLDGEERLGYPYFRILYFFQTLARGSVSNRLRSMYTWTPPTITIKQICTNDHVVTRKLFSSAKFRSRASIERRASKSCFILFKLPCNLYKLSCIFWSWNDETKRMNKLLCFSLSLSELNHHHLPVHRVIHHATNCRTPLCSIHPLLHLPFRWWFRRTPSSGWTYWTNCRNRIHDRPLRSPSPDEYYPIFCNRVPNNSYSARPIQSWYRNHHVHRRWLDIRRQWFVPVSLVRRNIVDRRLQCAPLRPFAFRHWRPASNTQWVTYTYTTDKTLSRHWFPFVF